MDQGILQWWLHKATRTEVNGPQKWLVVVEPIPPEEEKMKVEDGVAELRNKLDQVLALLSKVQQQQ